MGNEKVRQAVVDQVMATNKWSVEAARLAERADFRCEYCGLDFLASPENYKLFQVDHIVPISKGGSLIDFENFALACKPCNYSFKRSFDPRTMAGAEPTRAALITAAKQCIEERVGDPQDHS